jgi:hypothetical protein
MAMSRRSRLLVLGLSTVLLAVTAWTAVHAVSGLAEARAQVAASQAELAQLRNLVPTVEQHERYALAAERFTALVVGSGLDPARWTDRRVHRTTMALSRREAETLLRQQGAAGSGQWFAADRFDVAVVAPSAGLFTPAQPDDRGFSVEMSGTVYFPLDVK